MANSANPFTRGGSTPYNSVPLKERLRSAGNRWRNNWRMNGPNITQVLIAVNFVVFVIQVLVRFIPRLAAAVNYYGALSGSTVLAHPWTLLTSGFMHAGAWHLLMNMLSLYIAGKELERLLGHFPFLALYMVSLLGGSVTFASWYGPAGGVAAVGASGAIYGLFGALLAVYNRIGNSARSMIWFLLIFLLLPVFFGGIAWQAHLGGFFTGGLLSLAMMQGIPALRSASIGKRMAIYGSLFTVVLVALWLIRFALAGAFA